MKKNSFWLLIILILPFMEPLSFKEIQVLDDVYSVLKVICFFIILTLYVLNLKKNKYKMSKFMLIVVLYQLVLYISTFFNNGYYNELFGQTISVLATVMLTEIYINNKNIEMLIKVLASILFIYSIINIVTILNSMGTGTKINSFLGMDNRYIFYLLPLCVFTILRSVLKNDKLNKFSYLVIITSIFQVFYTWSVGAMIVITILLVFMLLVDKIPNIQKITFNTYFLLIVVLNILLVFVQVQYYFEDFIVNYLHKNIELSGRVYTWNSAIELIKENPILGIGGKTENIMKNMYYGTDQHAHNLFLNILVKGGIVALLIQFWMYFEIGEKLKKCNNKKISSVIGFSIFLILFLSLADTFDIYLVYIIYALAYHVDKIKIEEDKKVLEIKNKKVYRIEVK